MKLFTIAVACSTILFARAAEAAITIDSSFIFAAAYDGFFFGTAEFDGTTIPTHTTVNASFESNSSLNDIDWDVSGGQTILSLDMQHQRTGNANSYGRIDQDPLTFTADPVLNERYEFSGFYDVTDVGAPAQVYMSVSLFDVTDNVNVFSNEQNSHDTPNEQFTVGGTGGDNLNELIGSSTGTLIAGHQYQFRMISFTRASPVSDSGASGVGNVTLKIV